MKAIQVSIGKKVVIMKTINPQNFHLNFKCTLYLYLLWGVKQSEEDSYSKFNE